MKAASKIRSALYGVKNIPDYDKQFILELLEQDEWGVALETLCAVILDDTLEISVDTYLLIQEVGVEMELDSCNWISITLERTKRLGES